MFFKIHLFENQNDGNRERQTDREKNIEREIERERDGDGRVGRKE